jgi:hypothetical protein
MVLPLYRTFSLVTLYGILLAILAYGFTFVFYIASGAWAAPFVVNSSDDKVLELINQITVSQSTINTLQLDYDKTKAVQTASLAQRRDLAKLDAQLIETIGAQKNVWVDSSASLTSSHATKQQDNARLTADLAHTRELRTIVEKDLAKGLITKGDAQQQIMALDSFMTAATDSKVNETLLMDTVRQHQMTDINFLAVLAQKGQLEMQISQLDTIIRTSDEELKTDQSSMATIQAAVTQAKDSPLYDATTSSDKQEFAILSYNDKDTVKVGVPVYDCKVGMTICFNVGKVTHVYRNEQIFEHPLLHINMRGYVVKIEVEDKSAKSSTLIIGRKPLWF